MRMRSKSGQMWLACLLSGVLPLAAAEPAEPSSPTTANTTTTASEIEQLKQMLADQQRQINELRRQLGQEKKTDTGAPVSAGVTTSAPAGDASAADSAKPVSAYPNLGQVASTTPILPRPAASPIPALPAPQAAAAKPASGNPCEAPPDANSIPPYLRLGNICIAPVGFMDLTALWRDKDAGSSLGSNFGSVPYNNVAAGNNSEFRFTPQNSRIGFRIDGDWKGTHFIGYNEFDFLGTSGSTALTVTNGAFVPRLRLFWVDVRKNKVEFLAGQSWSMLTPNRTGISALPGNIFFSQVVDTNYMAGLTWTRQPGMRVLIHPTNKVTFGLSFENPDQYIGGSGGGSGITLPSGLAALASTQLDNAPNISGTSTVLAVPTVHPDIIAKIAFDPSSRFHLEFAGIERTFKIWNPNTTGPGALQHFTAAAGGAQVGINAEIFKNFRVISTDYWSDGGGRYLFGQAPDLIVRSDGSLSLVHAGGTVDGFEARVKPNTLLYAYYGGIYIRRNRALDANGTSVIGYGVSAGNQNRSIQELTFGFNQTIWASPRYGAVNLMGQYEYLMREPWLVAAGQPKAAHDNTIFFNVRYTLPGAMPNF